MTDVAVLGLSIDSSSAVSASAALDKLAVAGQAAADGADKLAIAGAKSETVLRAIQAAATREGISFDEMTKRVDNASESTDKHAAASTKAATATNTHATALGKAGVAAKDAKSELGKLDEIASVLESRMLHLGSNVGLFGEILSVIGPGGLAAAAGIGAIVVIADQLVSSANRMGEFSIQLQNLSTLSGLSTTALQALQTQAVGFGLSATQTGTYLERFSQQLEGVRRGSGNLYTELLKIDPALLAQISVAKNTTDALNLLAQAYVKAGASQNALAGAAAGGRGGAQFGLLLGDIATKGGVEELAASVNQLDLITTKQTETWARLKREIDEASSNARNNIASIYTGSTLEAQKTFYDKFLDLSREMKQFSLSSDYKTFIDSLTKDMGTGKTTLFGYLSSLPGKAMGALSNRISSVNSQNDLGMTDIGAGMTSGTWNGPVAEGPPAPPLGSLGDQASRAAAQLSFLGSAATATERYNAAIAKLNLDVSLNKDLTSLQSRAMAGLGLDRLASDATTYSSALGEIPTARPIEAENVVDLAQYRDEKQGKDRSYERDQRRLPAAA
jgi:hypothetical protein